MTALRRLITDRLDRRHLGLALEFMIEVERAGPSQFRVAVTADQLPLRDEDLRPAVVGDEEEEEMVSAALTVIPNAGDLSLIYLSHHIGDRIETAGYRVSEVRNEGSRFTMRLDGCLEPRSADGAIPAVAAAVTATRR